MTYRMPRVLDGAPDSSSVLGLSRAHAALNRPTVSALHLTVSGSGDDHDALVFRARLENLVRCGVRRLSIDARHLDGAGITFIRVLADAVTSARDQGCIVSTVGLDAAEVFEARDRTGRPAASMSG